MISDEIYKYISDKIQIDKKILTRLRGKTDKMAAYSVLGFKEKDTILELQRSLELALHLNPNLARDFYVHFLETKPEFQKFFQNTDMETQAKKLLAMFGRTIERFGNLNQIHNELKNLGKMHEEMGIKVTDLAEIAPSLLYALEKSLGERFQTEWKPIWEEALGSLVRLMSF